jgi:hypothetical protein
MDEFVLIFRRDFTSKEAQPAPDEMQIHLSKWQSWFANLTAQNKLSRPLQRWDREGKIVKRNSQVISGPYAEIKESIGGMIFVNAANYDDAATIASECPILDLGGNVEIRKAASSGDQ